MTTYSHRHPPHGESFIEDDDKTPVRRSGPPPVPKRDSQVRGVHMATFSDLLDLFAREGAKRGRLYWHRDGHASAETAKLRQELERHLTAYDNGHELDAATGHQHIVIVAEKALRIGDLAEARKAVDRRCGR